MPTFKTGVNNKHRRMGESRTDTILKGLQCFSSSGEYVLTHIHTKTMFLLVSTTQESQSLQSFVSREMEASHENLHRVFIAAMLILTTK